MCKTVSFLCHDQCRALHKHLYLSEKSKDKLAAELEAGQERLQKLEVRITVSTWFVTWMYILHAIPHGPSMHVITTWFVTWIYPPRGPYAHVVNHMVCHMDVYPACYTTWSMDTRDKPRGNIIPLSMCLFV